MSLSSFITFYSERKQYIIRRFYTEHYPKDLVNLKLLSNQWTRKVLANKRTEKSIIYLISHFPDVRLN